MDLKSQGRKKSGIHSEQKEKVDSSLPLKHFSELYIKLKASLPK